MGLLSSAVCFCRYWLYGRNHVRIIGNGMGNLHSTSMLRNSRIYIYPGASLTINEGCVLDNAVISVVRGKCTIGSEAIIKGASINIDDGSMIVNHHARIDCKRVWIRFGGELNIGEYTNINNGSEIRCDEKVSIGAFNQISYNVRIWDTNTHSVLAPADRREVTIEKFPYFGYESTRPKTSPVHIGNDCWIGENVVLLKGTSIGDRTIVGFGTMIPGKAIPQDSCVVNGIKLNVREL